jgi:hypothetical protein
MPSLEQHLERLASAQRWTYRASRESAAEPAAWTALALAAHGMSEAALRPARWLAGLQQPDGSLGVFATEQEPRWPTSLAMLAWSAVDAVGAKPHFTEHVALAAKWALAARGKTAPRSHHVGHDTELAGWSWAADTHSWLEPTCLFVMGLRAAGFADHPRVREGVMLIVDRLLPAGGANYGNTIVLGQPLVAHVQPTALALMALAEESIADPRIEKSLEYLEASISSETAAPSLALACLALTLHGRRPASCDEWILASLDRNMAPPLAAYEQSLLLLAASKSHAHLAPPLAAGVAGQAPRLNPQRKTPF